jgi:Domain of unknown function(DUF2779)
VEKHILSKSTFLRGLQCSKSLYLYKYFIQKRDAVSPEQKAIFNRGNKVGVLAQQLFPGGVDATPAKRSTSMAAVENTQRLIESGVEVIYEAAFQHNQVLAILDVLVKKDGAWYAYEVKSSTKISPTYLLDASLQYWVITNAGIPLRDISLIIINNQYIRKGALNLADFFSIKSVLKEAENNQPFIAENIQRSKAVIDTAVEPDVKIGEHCFSPYNCDFTGTCWKNIPKNSIFEISGVKKVDLFGLYHAGYKTIEQIPENNELDKNANIHIQAIKKKGVIIDQPAIAAFLQKLTYPLFFMDFETMMPAVPLYEQTKPYQHLPFQYSLHSKKTKEAPLEHVEFLAEQHTDPRKAFVEALLKHTETEGTILVYDILMERNVLNGLKKDFPQHAVAIDLRLSRMVDLVQPFQERSYYHPAMNNSFSMKSLLPALVPELSYSNLPISSGSIAMIAYENLSTETDMFKIVEIKEQLLEYCKLDTLAMVKVLEVLELAVAQ